MTTDKSTSRTQQYPPSVIITAVALLLLALYAVGGLCAYVWQVVR